jgi:hypothetical protein
MRDRIFCTEYEKELDKISINDMVIMCINYSLMMDELPLTKKNKGRLQEYVIRNCDK